MIAALRALAVRLRSFVRASTVDAELDEELRYHLEHETARLRAQGMNAGDAREAARRSFGNVELIKEASRDARGVRVVEHFFRDVWHALRLARKQPGFASIVVLSLALGLGATTTVFNLTYNVLFAPLAVAHPEELVALQRVSKDGERETFTWAEYRALRGAPGVGTLVAARTASAISIAAGEVPVYVNMYFVDGSFFPMLGLRPLQGRLLTPDDDARQMPVAVISEGFAERLFPGESGVVGRTITIRGAPFMVVGITPRSFRGLDFPGDFTAAIPLGTVPLLARSGPGRDDRGIRYGLTDDRQGNAQAFVIVGRRSAEREATRASLALAFQRCCADKSPGGDERLEVIDIRNGIPAGKNDFRGQARTILAILLAGMGLVLVIVCCNIASLLLVRASSRQREIAVRLSLGASRARLVGQLVIENLPLAVAGGLLGLVVAVWCSSAFVRSLPADWDTTLGVFQFHYAPAVIGFAAVATLVCAIAFTVYPALRATRQELAQALRLDAHASRSRRQGTVARGAVVGQIGFTVVLMTAAGLLAATLGNLARVDGGFATDNVLLVTVESRSTPYERGGVVPLHEEILRRVQAVPGVRAASMATLVPLFGGSNAWVPIDVPGFATPTGKQPEERLIGTVPGYFAVSGMRMVSGQEFTAADRAASEPVVIVNATFARRYFGDQDPVGHSFGVGPGGTEQHQVRIVGVVADAKYQDLRSAPEPVLYVPVVQTGDTWSGLQLVARTVGEPSTAASAVMRAIDAAAPGIQIRRVRDMRTQRDYVMTVERLAARLALFVSAMALVLSAVGLYGVVAYSVARRTSELGIRMALGARERAIIWLVVREIIGFVGVGVLVGLPLSFAANRAMASQLFGVGAHDPVLAAVAILLLTAVALLAGAVPASRAARIDPRIALSAE